MKRSLWIVIAALAAPALLALGFFAGRRAAGPEAQRTALSAAATSSKRVLYWYDPMLPTQHFDRPGRSPMGMQLVPKYADEAATGTGVRIDPRTVQNLGIRTAPVESRALARDLAVPATVSWDLREARTVSARAAGIVTRLDVRAPYTAVRAGQPLAALLAPAWSSAIDEYAALMQSHSADALALRAAARRRLEVLGLDRAEIEAAARGASDRPAVVLRAPQAGVVVTVDVREGQAVAAGQTLMTLNTLDTVWLEAEIPQADAAGIGAGTKVTATVDAEPGHRLRGVVEALLPQVDPESRAQRARMVLENSGHRLVPGMFATVRLHPAAGTALPVVPDGAIIATGKATRVVVAGEDGRFRVVPVTLGRSAAGYTQVLTGLRAGERIVVSGQFLIDSEASLSGALERL